MPAISLSGQSRQRQIVMIAVGGLLLAGLLMFQVPRMMKMMKPKGVGQPAPTTSTPTPATPVPPGAPPVPVTPTDQSPRLVSLTRFKSKDPFIQQIGSGPTASGAPAGSSAPASSESSSESTSGAESASQTAAPTKSAKIAVNGSEENVNVSSAFPNGNPVFKLVSLTDNTAKVGVASGTLKGSQTVTLVQGEPLTLLNTVDGKRYTLKLISVVS